MIYNVYVVGNGWDKPLSEKYKLKSISDAESKMYKLANEDFEKIYYIQCTILNDKSTVYDYGSHTRFIRIDKE